VLCNTSLFSGGCTNVISPEDRLKNRLNGFLSVSGFYGMKF